MLKKGFLKDQVQENTKHYRFASVVSKALLYIGLIVLIASFTYLLFNLDKADDLIGILLPFLFAGLGLLIVSQLIIRSYKKLRK